MRATVIGVSLVLTGVVAGAVHNATNKGSGAARILATYVVEKGKPLATPVATK